MRLVAEGTGMTGQQTLEAVLQLIGAEGSQIEPSGNLIAFGHRQLTHLRLVGAFLEPFTRPALRAALAIDQYAMNRPVDFSRALSGVRGVLFRWESARCQFAAVMLSVFLGYAGCGRSIRFNEHLGL